VEQPGAPAKRVVALPKEWAGRQVVRRTKAFSADRAAEVVPAQAVPEPLVKPAPEQARWAEAKLVPAVWVAQGLLPVRLEAALRVRAEDTQMRALPEPLGVVPVAASAVVRPPMA